METTIKSRVHLVAKENQLNYFNEFDHPYFKIPFTRICRTVTSVGSVAWIRFIITTKHVVSVTRPWWNKTIEKTICITSPEPTNPPFVSYMCGIITGDVDPFNGQLRKGFWVYAWVIYLMKAELIMLKCLVTFLTILVRIGDRLIFFKAMKSKPNTNLCF